MEENKNLNPEINTEAQETAAGPTGPAALLWEKSHAGNACMALSHSSDMCFGTGHKK